MSMADGRKEEGMSDIGRIWRPFWGSAGGSWVGLGRLGAVPEHLGGPWGVPGSFLDRLGVVLGASWAVSGSSWAVLGPCWARLGASWGSLGGVLGRLWGAPGASWSAVGAQSVQILAYLYKKKSVRRLEAKRAKTG